MDYKERAQLTEVQLSKEMQVVIDYDTKLIAQLRRALSLACKHDAKKEHRYLKEAEFL